MDNWAVVDWNKDVWHFIVRMIVSIVCGFAIGLERKSRSKEAGIRTHAIVCLASCLFMILSKYLTAPLFSDIAGNVFDGDATRIAAQVVTGIGFLGAGIIMYRRDVMHGLTTAAGVWATSAIGMAVGGGFIVTGVCATVIILLLQLIFHLPIKAFTTRHIALIKMQIWIENDDVLNQILDKLGTNKVSSYKVKQVGESIIATIEVATTDELDPMKFNSLIREFPTHLLSIERADE
ncbi:MAG TPA: methyltransferase [Clostridiales bacterium]|nr:methyltransferase [Clostridiales bacterium]HBP52193.1 methyltransferase [Clostridiales bacterium]HBW06009.1 methyltransferase [Clostridiales bacterium]